jgi:beta-lactamase regulating signal transducer with metallopeptidase domain
VPRALLSGRGPVRWVWLGALLLSLLTPVAAFRLAGRSDAPTGADITGDVATGADAGARVSGAASQDRPTHSSREARTLRGTVARYDAAIAMVWITLSLAVAINFAAGLLVLALMRRRWQRRTVLGVPVLVSERTGPAVVGAFSPAIVLPEWALSLESSQLALMLRHEQEHQRAGDGRLLTAVEFALIAMPWNIALWWQVLRLRVAVELDCDARVLRDADAQSYGNLLLEVARPRRRFGLMPATAFAERATQLERRIRLLSRHRLHPSRAARILAGCIGLAALTVAWMAPHPPVLPRKSSLPGAPVITPELLQRTPALPEARGATRSAGAANPPATAGVTETPATPAEPRRRSPAAGIDRARANPLVDSIFERLFAGITLTRNQEEGARQLLHQLELQQSLQDKVTAAALQVEQLRVVTLQTQRDAALRALLTNDADRAIFDERVVALQSGRGRSGGVPRSPLLGARRGGGGGDTLSDLARALEGRARRGGGSGGRQDRVEGDANLALTFAQMTNQMTFRRLFMGIQLSADQEAAARALIGETQEKIQAGRPAPVRVILRLNHRTGTVIMQADSAAALLGLVTNEADRATLESRIVVQP